MARNKLEQVLEYLVAGDESKAKDLLHQVFIEKARQIHEELISAEEMDEETSIDDDEEGTGEDEEDSEFDDDEDSEDDEEEESGESESSTMKIDIEKKVYIY
jgi:hypothetical protein